MIRIKWEQGKYAISLEVKVERILILGATGLVGNALFNELKDTYEVFGTYNKSDVHVKNLLKMNVDNEDELVKVIEETKPDIIISSIRGDYDKQIEIHRLSAEYIKRTEGRFYFLSTVNVFDKLVDRPHYEIDIPKAESEYGKFKIKCENELKEILGQNLTIFRLPFVWGMDCPRLEELINKVENRQEIIVYDNLYIENAIDIYIAKQITHVIKMGYHGIFHLCSGEEIRHDVFYNELAKAMKLNDPIFHVKKYHDVEESNLSMLTCRKEIPEELVLSNAQIIDYLSKKK